MNPVRRKDDGFEVDAAYLAEHLHLDPAEVPYLLRAGQISARCERGEGEDAGRYRLSFRLGRSTLSVVIDKTGRVLHRKTLRWPAEQERTNVSRTAAGS